jgi:hypothetical protein
MREQRTWHPFHNSRFNPLTTTALIVEYLIIGVFACIWVFLGLLTWFGLQWGLEVWSYAEKYAGLSSFIFISTAYVLGVITERVASIIFLITKPTKKALKIKFIEKRASHAHGDPRVVNVMVREGRVSELMQRLRNRMRVTRAICLNSLLITIFCVLFMANKYDVMSILYVVSLGFIFISTSGCCSIVLEVTYRKRLEQAIAYDSLRRVLD